MEKVAEISKILLISFLIITIIPALATNLQPTKAISLNELFSEHFDGEALFYQNGFRIKTLTMALEGPITVANSYVYLTSNGTSFPIAYSTHTTLFQP